MPTAEISDHELRLLRSRSQGLLEESRSVSVAAATKAALAIQAQDVPNGLLGVRARTTLTEDEAVRQGKRATVCRSWLMRNTLFLFAARDLAWMRPVLADHQLKPAIRRFDQLGMPPAEIDRLMNVLRERLAEGPLTRPDARALLISEGVDPGEHNERIYWTFGAAAIRGVLVLRPALDRKHAFAAAPEDDPLPREKALGRLARRYLKAHGPATEDDFAYWLKAPKADARLGWENAGRTVEARTERGPMTALPENLAPIRAAGPVVRLLGQWDHMLLSWVDKSLVLPDHQKDVRLVSGRRTGYLDGRAFATWTLDRGSRVATVKVAPFEKLPRGARPALEAEVADIGRWLEKDTRLELDKP